MGEVASAPSFVEVKEEDCRPSDGEQGDTEHQQQEQQPSVTPQIEEAKEAIPSTEGDSGQVGKQDDDKENTEESKVEPAGQELIAGEKLIKAIESSRISEHAEVTSTENHQHHQNNQHHYHQRRGSRPRNTGQFQQNYGLVHLPYKSNFEPSDQARRKADEFLQKLKL